MTVTEVDAFDVPWQRCPEQGCTGARGSATACLAHLTGEEKAGALAAISRGRPLDVRGVKIDGRLLDEILGASPRDDCGRPVLNRARFDRATFDGDAAFGRVVFTKDTSFDRARFAGDATFDSARFEGSARFAQAAFTARGRFQDAAFAGQAWFGGATFEGVASFEGSEFSNMAWFGRAEFATDAHFKGATFRGDTNFDGAAFRCHALFADASFLGEARLDRARFEHDPSYHGAAFTGKGGAPQAAVRQAVWSGTSLAPWPARALARVIDDGIFAAVVAAAAGLGLALEVVLQYKGALVAFSGIGLAAAAAFLVRNLVDQGHTGQTLGKRRRGICVVRERDGLPVGPGRSIARHLLHVLDTLPALAGWLRPLWDPKHQTLADSVLTTVVVRRSGWARVGATERAAAAGPAEPPPGGG